MVDKLCVHTVLMDAKGSYGGGHRACSRACGDKLEVVGPGGNRRRDEGTVPVMAQLWQIA